MTMTARAASTFVLMTSLLACSGVENAAGGSGTGGSSVIACSSDAQCSGGGCVQGKCIGRASLPPTWAAEIRPTTGSTAPTTEQIVLAMDPSSRFVELTADPRIDVRVTFNPPAGTPLPAPANVVLSVPSTIPGRPDRIFESGIAKDPLSNTVANVVTFEVPASVMMHSGTITLTPLSPADQQSPPFSFAIDSLGTDITLAIPTDSV